MGIDLKTKPWWDYLQEDVQELLDESLLLVETVKVWAVKFHDYSFVVFPAAKAYEGFLKKLFLDMNFITKEEYFGKRFRIGKALNPQLERELRHESVYDKLVEFCKSENLAQTLWDTWKTCRNSLFHWFPEEKTAINFEEAKASLALIIDSIDKAWGGCRINLKDAQR